MSHRHFVLYAKGQYNNYNKDQSEGGRFEMFWGDIVAISRSVMGLHLTDDEAVYFALSSLQSDYFDYNVINRCLAMTAMAEHGFHNHSIGHDYNAYAEYPESCDNPFRKAVFLFMLKLKLAQVRRRNDLGEYEWIVEPMGKPDFQLEGWVYNPESEDA